VVGERSWKWRSDIEDKLGGMGEMGGMGRRMTRQERWFFGGGREVGRLERAGMNVRGMDVRGIPQNHPRDEEGTESWSQNNIKLAR
jgi:hypothetical protein